jgi:prepilin-type N-terminal cleavage/methylation domain-containing protein
VEGFFGLIRKNLERNMRQKHSEQSGFTLIEAAIALAILVIALLGVASVFIYVNRYNSGASDRAMALVIAQQQMEKLRNVSFTSPDLSATSPSVVTTETNAGIPYTVTLTVIDDTPTRKTIMIEVAPQRSSSIWSKSSVVLVTQRSALTNGPYIG